MLVIDYLRHLDTKAITVPAFHRGHLGLLPNTPVNIALMTDPVPDPLGAELFVTPFDSHTSNLFKLTCVLRDVPGAVDRIVSAVSSLNLNIVIQESACINHLRHHVTNLLLDWGPSDKPSFLPVPPEFKNAVEELAEVLPANDYRYFKLYERLLAFCGDLLQWQEGRSPDKELPLITITPFELRENFIWAPSLTAAEDDIGKPSAQLARPNTRHRFQIPIPDKILYRVSEITGYAVEARMPYILLSDTYSRTLRVFFLRLGMEERTVSVAFSHLNLVGALSTVTELLAKSSFNILTSILRKENDNRNIWEVFLEYRGEAEMSQARTSAERAKWVKDRLDLDSVASRGLLKKYGVRITTSRYPLSLWDPEFREDLFNEDDAVQSPKPYLTRDALERTKLAISKDVDRRKREWVLGLLEPGPEAKPRAFLSYPFTATRHADIVKHALAEMLELDEYQKPNQDEIAPTVIKKIKEAEFFLAIWHPDGERPREVSPWMPFEYGIASALHKKVIIVVEESIDPKVWLRIEPHISRLQYSDLYFKEDTVSLIVEHVKKVWLSH